MVGISIIYKGMVVILGANLLFLFWCGIVALRMHFRGRSEARPTVQCVRCKNMGAEFTINNVQGKFCKKCWGELV